MDDGISPVLAVPLANTALSYANLYSAKQKLFGIEAIDFYLAKQLTNMFQKHTEPDILNAINSTTSHVIDQIFHLVIELSKALRDGHTCLPLLEVSERCVCRNVDQQGTVTHQGFVFDKASILNDLLRACPLIESECLPLVLKNKALYLRRYFNFEQEVSDYFVKARGGNAEQGLISTDRASEIVEQLFPSDDNNSNEVDWQKVAVANSLNKRFSIIAGGPGTGKTYTVTKLLAAILLASDSNQPSISLVAPTGKAAQRLSESINSAVLGFKDIIPDYILDKIPKQAQTIHRLLGVIKNSPNFKHNNENKLNVDVLLIDEVSMVDLPMMARVFRALPASCRVVLLGDAQQLPSVAAGSVLADLAPNNKAMFSVENTQYLEKVTTFSCLPTSKRFALDHVCFLVHSRRFTGEGGIGQIAKQVIAGQANESWQYLTNFNEQSSAEIDFLAHEKIEPLINLAINQYEKVANAGTVEQAFDLLASFRILVAMRSGLFGVKQMNKVIEHGIRHRIKDNYTSFDALYHGKPIMITKNDYGLGLYNGDIGLIWKNELGQLMAVFETDNNEFKYFLPTRLPEFETVYAMTIHKTQGSEFSHVALILPQEANNQMLSRELIYTGITRAKRALTVVATKSSWINAVDTKVKRFSGIKLIN